MTKESLTEMVVYGLGVMPAFGEDEILTKEEIDTVVYYVLNSVGK
jgi:mono/diheme cytochrome c family protein